MATALKKLTGMGGDVRKLARLLQARAPENHMLAYINPQEAALLKAHGGSGKPHEDTGIPSFELDDDFSLQGGENQAEAPSVGENYVSPVTVGEAPVSAAPAPVTAAPQGSADRAALFGPSGYGEGVGALPGLAYNLPAREAFDTAKATQAVTGAQPSDSILKQLADKTGLKEETLNRLGIAGVQGLLGSRAASKAAAEGQQGRADIQALATPYQQKGQQLQAAAQRGELTPQAMQSLQAVQAQTAQGAEKRGGVGAAQAAQQVEAFRQQLLAQQYDYGLKLSGIGDQIALGAIKTGMQADQVANQLTNSYFNNIARTVYGQPAAA